MRVALLIFLLFCASCSNKPKGGEFSLRVNGIPVFMSQLIDEVIVTDNYVTIEFTQNDGQKLRAYIEEFYKDGGYVDVYIGESNYEKDIYLQSNYSDDWQSIKLVWEY